MATSTVNSTLRSNTHTTRLLGPRTKGTPVFWSALILSVCALLPASQATANTAAELDVLRVDVPLERASFKNGELKISSLIANNTYIDVEEFNLRAIELEASSTRDGEVRLKVGRYVTPPVPLPGPNNEGLLRIEAPHKSNKSWRLLIEDRINITSLTAVLEPRDNNSEYYESRYESRGYTLGRDDNYRPYSRSRHDNWPYSWLGNNYDYNRRSAHWFWLNDTRSRFLFNPGYGHSHRHTPRCYDRYGRHLSFNSGFNSSIGTSRGTQRSRDLNRYRDSRGARLEQRREQRRDQRPARNPNREPVMRAPITTRNQDAQRNQAAQAQLQQRMQQAQARAQQQQQRQQRQERQQRRDANERRSGQMGPRAPRADRTQRRQRSTMQQGSKGQRQDR